MKRGLLVGLLLFISFVVQAQGEATHWYFGQNAGLKFMPDGSVVALSDGQLVTTEGCSSISDSSGNLLFYTDGKTVWDRNHIIMPNGVNLFGDPSSTQSGIIVPKPNNPNIYYIFTVDEPHQENAAVYPNGFIGSYVSQPTTSVPTDDDGFNNGFNFSVVDLSVIGANGSIGDVVSKNNPLITYDTNPNGEEIKFKCSEKITAVKDFTTGNFWVVTHFINKFYAFKIDANGVTTAPVITSIGANVGISGYRRNSIGYLKASPDGQKLAIAHNQIGNQPGGTAVGTGIIELFDFNTATGIISNARTVIGGVQPYGVEFSASSEKLYASYNIVNNQNIELAQFDLLSSNITASKTIIYNSTPQIYGLQLALNNKIYVSTTTSVLGVINAPDENGLLCNYVHAGLQLASGTVSRLGLPPFITSFFFVPAIQLENACVGQNTVFEFNTSQIITSVVWDFGDGTTSTELSPSHVYAAAGEYTVSVTVTSTNGTGVNSREITIYDLPVLNTQNINLKQCDDNNDGFSTFNLNEANILLVNNPSEYTITYHLTLQDAKDNTEVISNTTSYGNQTVSGQTIFARVENSNGCYSTAQINLQVSTTQIPVAFQKVFSECDDTLSGSNTDGIATFNFSSVTAEILDLYPDNQLVTIQYYRNLADALAEQNAISNISNYTNTDAPGTQNIYVRVDSQVNNECLALGHHITLTVEPLPIIPPLLIEECDDNQDGIFAFDTTNLETNLLNGLTGVSVFYTDENGVALPNPFPNPFTTASRIINVRLQNNFGKQCEYFTTITFTVADLPEAFPIPVNLTSLCDDEIDSQLQDGSVPFDTSEFDTLILGNQTGVEVRYFDQNNVPLIPLPNPFVSGTQTLRAEVVSTVNQNCAVSIDIPLIVLENPTIRLTDSALICTDDLRFSIEIDAGLIDPSLQNQYTYSWFFNNTVLPDETNYTLRIEDEGTYTVLVENQLGCTSSRSIEVIASNSAIIENIVVTDLSDNNSITVKVSGLGKYVYNLNGGAFQESEVFSGLPPGIYTVGIADENGCNTVFETVYILGAPKYFTPNGDTYNDSWNIQFLDPTLNLKITIFDRFGKLLKLFNPKETSWDGTYNGNPLPSTDYWYVIEFENGRFERGHFSLVR